MASNLSCLIVTEDKFPDKKLSELLLPDFSFSEIDNTASLSDAFQFLLNSNFNLCLIGVSYQDELEPFFRDMHKIGRDKTCAFVKVASSGKNKSDAKNPSETHKSFCASIGYELSEQDIRELRNALSKEIVRMSEERRVDDIPKYVELVLKEIDNNARKIQRGINATYDKVIAGLVKDMMSESSLHRDSFIEELSSESDKSIGFATTTVEVPDQVLNRNLPKLSKTKYMGRSSRVWENLLKRYGNREVK